MIILTPMQSRLYTWLCANVDPCELLPTAAEIARGACISDNSVYTALACLARAGLIRGYRSTYCGMWIYEMAIINASYEIKSASRTHGEMDAWDEARMYGY